MRMTSARQASECAGMSLELRSRRGHPTRARQEASTGETAVRITQFFFPPWSLVAEADLLEEAARGAVEELGPDLLALQVVRIALDHAAARLRDQVEGSTNRHGCDACPPIVPVDEDARDAIRGLPRETGFPFLPVIDPRKLLRRAVLTPRHRGVAVEDQGGVRFPLANEGRAACLYGLIWNFRTSRSFIAR